jgi:hypothetical protein
MIIDHGVGDIYQQDNGYLTGMTSLTLSVAMISEPSDVDIWKGQPRAGGTWQGKPKAGGNWENLPGAGGTWKDQQDK